MDTLSILIRDLIGEMDEGICFFEGYIPSIGNGDLLTPLLELMHRARVYSFAPSVWSDDTPDTDSAGKYAASEYVEFFRSNRIVCLHFDYEMAAGSISLNYKLIFENSNATTSLEIICYRDAIMRCKNREEAAYTAIEEFRYLNKVFSGDALFIGPDTLDYPLSATDYPDEWMRLE